jgi:hypothetical protein
MEFLKRKRSAARKKIIVVGFTNGFLYRESGLAEISRKCLIADESL